MRLVNAGISRICGSRSTRCQGRRQHLFLPDRGYTAPVNGAKFPRSFETGLRGATLGRWGISGRKFRNGFRAHLHVPLGAS